MRPPVHVASISLAVLAVLACGGEKTSTPDEQHSTTTAAEANNSASDDTVTGSSSTSTGHLDSTGAQSVTEASTPSADETNPSSTRATSSEDVEQSSSQATIGGQPSDVATTSQTSSAESEQPSTGNTSAGGSQVSTATSAGSSNASDAAATSDGAVRSSSNQCLAFTLGCGEQVQHSTLDVSGASLWNAYASSARFESGTEMLYRFDAEAGCRVNVVLSQASSPLDFFRLTKCVQIDAAAFDIVDSAEASTRPEGTGRIQQFEFTINAGEETFVVVDSFAGEEGSYTLDVACDCP